jgi:hypothetical protein
MPHSEHRGKPFELPFRIGQAMTLGTLYEFLFVPRIGECGSALAGRKAGLIGGD